MNSCGPPLDLFPYVLDFCRSITQANEPVYLVPEPNSGGDPLDCFINVRRHVEASGGTEVMGRRIWEHYGILMEAEAHSVWKTPNGTLHDVTPCAISPQRILFLPDLSLRYEERQINNVFQPLIASAKLKEFIRLTNEEFDILNAGERAYQHGAITLEGEEAERMQALQLRKTTLLSQIMRTPPGRNDPCRCGQGRKYKNCCGRA